jgi:hypothetical protein
VQEQNILFTFIWTRNLFYYLPYNLSTQALSTQAYNQMMNEGTLKALTDDTRSNLGEAFQSILADPARK